MHHTGRSWSKTHWYDIVFVIGWLTMDCHTDVPSTQALTPSGEYCPVDNDVEALNQKTPRARNRGHTLHNVLQLSGLNSYTCYELHDIHLSLKNEILLFSSKLTNISSEVQNLSTTLLHSTYGFSISNHGFSQHSASRGSTGQCTVELEEILNLYVFCHRDIIVSWLKVKKCNFKKKYYFFFFFWNKIVK